MKPRTLLILLLLVAGLGAFVWFKERKLPSASERAAEAKKVLPLKGDEVGALEIEATSHRVRFEREGEGATSRRWKLTSPMTAGADGAEVNRVLDALLGLEKQRTLDDFDAAELGLAKPRASVTFETATGKRVLRVGAELPSSDSMVVAVEGETAAYVVASSISKDLERAPGDWRDRALFHGERSAIQSLRLTSELGASTLLGKRGEEFWLESPLTDRADREGVDELVSAVTGLSATSFLDTAPAAGELGLSPPVGTIEVVLRDVKEPFRVAVGKATAEGSLSHYLRVGEQLVTADVDLGTFFGKAPESWRSLAWMSFDSWSVESATFEDSAGKLELAREGGAWKRGGVEIPYTPVGDLFTALTDAKAERLAPPGEAFSPSLTVTLKGKEGVTETLTLAAAQGESVPARVSGREAVLLLPTAKVDDLFAKLAAVRAAEPVKKEPSP